jgi:hypothetical protein
MAGGGRISGSVSTGVEWRGSMVVISQCIGNRVTGLYIGPSNVRRYFRRHVESIELQIDHLLIACGLSSHFWLDQPEIHDPRLCAWLESKHRDGNGKGHRSPVSMAMIPSGKDSFILSDAALDIQLVATQKLEVPPDLHIPKAVSRLRVADSAPLSMAGD